MSRFTGPRLRIVRRLGKLPGLTSKVSNKTGLPGQHGLTVGKKVSEYAIRLKEKQKLRFYYLVTERQLLNYLKKARAKKGSSGKELISLLEMRLDNIVFRLGFSPTISSARQLITHGHILVNNKLVTIPSFGCKSANVISVVNSRPSRELIKKNLDLNKDFSIPSHLSLNKDELEGKINSQVSFENLLLIINELLVVEFYSLRL